MIYLDNAATTRSMDSAAAAVLSAMTEGYANPSALYNTALAAEKEIRKTQDLIREMLGASDYEVLFTSGGTESNNLAIFGSIPKGKVCRCMTTTIEHPSVAQVFDELENRGHEVVRLDCTAGLNYAQLEEELQKGCDLISVMHVNNETGAVQDIRRIGELIRKYAPDAVFHVDGVQSFCRVPIHLRECRVDLFTLSGHKIHAIKGIGALVVGKRVKLNPQLLGGGQQMALRPGTQNMPGICALGAACLFWKENGEKERARIRAMKEHLANAILEGYPKAQINGPAVKDGAPHIVSVAFPGLRGETLLHALEEQVIVGTGSACSSHKKGLSSVLLSQGVKQDAVQGTIRISLGLFNTMEEMTQAGEVICQKAAYLARFKRR